MIACWIDSCQGERTCHVTYLRLWDWTTSVYTRVTEKADSSFSQSRNSSMTSLDNVNKEAIQCIVFADAYTRKAGHSPAHYSSVVVLLFTWKDRTSRPSTYSYSQELAKWFLFLRPNWSHIVMIYTEDRYFWKPAASPAMRMCSLAFFKIMSRPNYNRLAQKEQNRFLWKF